MLVQFGTVPVRVRGTYNIDLVLQQRPHLHQHQAQGDHVSANNFVEALGRFMKTFKQKRPIKAAGEWVLHFDIAPVLTAADMTKLSAARQYLVIEQWLFFLYMAFDRLLYVLECE